jgi:hypothetical protein
MTPLERLLAEELPTGTFGHAQPPARRPRPIRPWTSEEQAQHLADLNAALEGWQDSGEHAARDRNRHRPAHLRVVDGTSDSEAAA